MALVAGVDSSTQSCKVVIVDADSGTVIRQGKATHPEVTEIHPDRWWEALLEAIANAGGLADVAAISIGGQQHGMVALDRDGRVIRPALLWNDTRSAPDAEDLIRELGEGDREAGAAAWANRIGTVPVPSLTITKVRWLARVEPENADKLAALALPHDWLSWRLAGNDPNTSADLSALATDRSDASGTGYWSPVESAAMVEPESESKAEPESKASATSGGIQRGEGSYLTDLLALALGRPDSTNIVLPTVLPGNGESGRTRAVPGVPDGIPIGAGAGDNAAAGFGIGAGVGDVVISIGTSGTVFAVSSTTAHDPSGTVAGFASADGVALPLVCTLNAARVLDSMATLLSVDHDQLAELALSAPMGADGLTLIPYLEGERTPNRPLSTGALHGLRISNMSPAPMARAAFEGLLCGLADGVDALIDQGVTSHRAILVGGAAGSPAFIDIAPAILELPVVVPPPGEYVALGAARQAAWLVSGNPNAPQWQGTSGIGESPEPARFVRTRYAEVREMTANRE